MAWAKAITAALVLGYALVMLGGWVLCGVGHLSARFWPAMAQAGSAIAIIPTYLFALWLARLAGHGRPPGDLYALLALLATVVLTVVLTGLAIWQGLIAWRDERAARAAGGC